jgi:Cu/Ag efflux protein CusF
MPSRGFYLLVLGLGPIALTACVETEAATAQPTSSAVPAIGVDLGNSARVPQIAGLAGEGEGYGRTELGTTPVAHSSMPGMNHGSTSGMQMDHGTMPDMNHGSTSGMRMDHGSMPGMGHGSPGGMEMTHGSMPGMRHAPKRNMQMAHSGHTHAQGTGTVNSIDAAAHKVNVSHGPISTIGLPAMTMDFAVAPTVDLQAVKPGTRVNFTIERGEGGMYVIQSIKPAGGGR